MTENYDNINPSFRFHVEIQGIIEGLFIECAGLGAKRKIFKYKEGGLNEFIHQLPDRVTYTNVKFKRGLGTPKLFDWFAKGMEDGNVQYTNVSILLYGFGGSGLEVVRQWDLEKCYPVKWTAPSLKTDSKRAAIETLEIAHHGISQTR